MPRTRSLAWSELKLGIVGVGAVVLAALLIVAVGGEGGFPWQRYPLRTTFDDVAGLKAGAVVRVSGKDVGKVTTLTFSGARIEVAMTISKSVRPLLTNESRPSIGSLSLLGEPIIEISAAPQGTPVKDDGYVLAAPAAQRLTDLAATAGKDLDQVTQLVADVRAGKGTMGKLITDQAVYDELQGFLGAATRVTQSLESSHGTMGSLINDPKVYTELTASLQNLHDMTTRLNNGEGALGALLKDPDMAASLKATTSNLQGITDRMTKSDGTMGKLINEHELYDKLNNVAQHVDDLTQALNNGKGSIAQLVHDRQLYDNMNSVATELKGLLADIRKDPRKYLNVHVSIF